MKRVLFLFILAALMIGCGRDANGVLYSEYPIVNRAYRTYPDSLGNYTVFWFENSGFCRKETKNLGNSISIENNYSYWMTMDTVIAKSSTITAARDSVIFKDSLFVKYEIKDGVNVRIYRGCFYDTFIVLQSDTLIRYR